jgi:hypothetical protein
LLFAVTMLVTLNRKEEWCVRTDNQGPDSVLRHDFLHMKIRKASLKVQEWIVFLSVRVYNT